MQLKRTLSAILILVFMVALSGCNQSAAPESSLTAEEEALAWAIVNHHGQEASRLLESIGPQRWDKALSNIRQRYDRGFSTIAVYSERTTDQESVCVMHAMHGNSMLIPVAKVTVSRSKK